jgi:hypothetical protein
LAWSSGFSLVSVGGTFYTTPDFDGCKPFAGGHGLRFPTQTIGVLEVTPTLYLGRTKPFGRQLVFVKNTSAAPTTIAFLFDGDLGSDSDTNVDRSSSGDQTVDGADVWATSCEDLDADGCLDTKGEKFRDPELAHNWERKGKKPKSADQVVLADGNGDFNVSFLASRSAPARPSP